MKQIAFVCMCTIGVIGLAAFGVRSEPARHASSEENNVTVKSPPRKTDLNSATVRELSKLPGIGIELAERIVRHRPYRKLDQLIAKKVLGRKQFARIKDRIRVSSVP
jgi:DNA uptake protein ComE-like DNA-binding protein